MAYRTHVQLSDEDLNHCATEPIHVPGSIQPHGCLLAFDSESHVVVQASANVEAFLGTAAHDLLGRRVSDVLPLAHIPAAALNAATSIMLGEVNGG